jgi:predicted nucleotidyltransferase
MRISKSQRQLHVLSEGVALFVIAPFLLSVSKNEGLTEGQRRGLQATAVATILVDGYLLSRWMQNR